MKLDVKTSQMCCKVFEDNTSCITIAEGRKTKHISLKYHWFRQFLSGPNKLIEIKYVNTKEQIADILTKPLEIGLFKNLRKKSNGW